MVILLKIICKYSINQKVEDDYIMVKIYYIRYYCQICGKQSNAPSPSEIPTCLICHKNMCQRCAIGGFCKDCIKLFPENLRKPYEKKAKLIKRFLLSMFILFLIILLSIVGGFILSASGPRFDKLGMAIGLIGFSLFPIYLCIGSILLVIIQSIKRKHSKKGALELLKQYALQTT